MSRILREAHELAVTLNKVGVMSDERLQQIEREVFPQKRRFSADEVRRIRDRSEVSLPYFAQAVGVGPATVEQWEQGLKRPTGASARLLDIIDRKGIDAVL